MERGREFHDTLVLVYGMACPLKCDFCCHPVEEYGPVKMKKEEAIAWIQEASTLPSFRLVAFTGGEPFVYYRELLEILEATAPCRLPVRIVTAAQWARTVDEAKAKLGPLKDRGLTELSVSTDPSHQVFVPAAFAEHAVRAAVELGITCELAGVFWDPDTEVEDIVRVPPEVKVTRQLAVPIGRGTARRISAEEYRLGCDRFGGCGIPDAYDITVYPDGEVYPCCSGGFNRQAKLSVGNLEREALRTIVERAHADRYVRYIMEAGFLSLYELARFKFPGVFQALPDWTPFVSICQLCAAVHSNPELLEVLEPVLRYAERLRTALAEVAERDPEHAGVRSG
jgi:MoaA/NifB/PqqE/SkfB family radical SAM enzyme